jgi:hypothetical protein
MQVLYLIPVKVIRIPEFLSPQILFHAIIHYIVSNHIIYICIITVLLNGYIWGYFTWPQV